MKACKHFERIGWTEIYRAFHEPWNAWLEVYSEDGRLIYRSFETGLWDRYLRHLLKHEECLREIAEWYRVDPVKLRKEIEEEIKEIDREWREVMGDDC